MVLQEIFKNSVDRAYSEGFRDGACISIIIFLILLTFLSLLKIEFGAKIIAILAVAGCLILGALMLKSSIPERKLPIPERKLPIPERKLPIPERKLPIPRIFKEIER